MQYVVKSKGKLLNANGKRVDHFNEAQLFPTRQIARWAKEDFEYEGLTNLSIYRVKVKPVEFLKVR